METTDRKKRETVIEENTSIVSVRRIDL